MIPEYLHGAEKDETFSNSE